VKSFIFLSVFAMGAAPALANQGDNIRDRAPLTALVFDARADNPGPLRRAYLNDEIDFFIDFERLNTKSVQELRNLREAAQFIEANDYATAEARLRSISGFNDEKIYLRAVLDASLGRYQQSLEGFRQIIDRRHSIESKRLINLSFMGAARVFHEVQDYSQAIYHYNQVRQLESEFFSSVFEKAWSFYLSGDMNGALGATLTFDSPFFESAFFPEAWVVRAASFFQLCRFDRASATVEAAKKKFEPSLRQIRELQRRDPRSWIFDERLLSSVEPSIIGWMVADTRFRSALRAQLALQKEVKALEGRREATTASQALAYVRSRLVAEAQRVLRAAEQQLTDTLSQLDIIGIEILQAAANQLLGQPLEEAAQVRIIDLGDVDFDARVQFWPFKGEFWVDELGSYYYGLKSLCETSGSSQSGET
jgi:tetratricopeptide (TPR) repeat protein